MSVFPPHQNQTMYGHQDVVRRLKQAVDGHTLHHAIILSGAEGIGKETLCYQLIRYALSRPSGEDDGGMFGGGLLDDPSADKDDFLISEEHPVFRKIAAQSHPHVFTIQPVFDEKKQRFKRDITLAALDGLDEFLRLKPSEDAPRFIIINPAEGMNNNTQNALLKMLEEPPEKTHFFLLTTQMGRLLPTIRSRCLAVTMEPVSFEDFRRALEKLEPEMSPQTIKSLYGLSGGAIGQALQNHDIGALESYGNLCRAILSWQKHDAENDDDAFYDASEDSVPAMKYAEEIAREEVLAERMVEIVAERLAVLLKAMVTGQKIDAIIPEEDRVLTLWSQLTQPQILDIYDFIRAQWAACDAGYLDRKLTFLQIIKKLSAA